MWSTHSSSVITPYTIEQLIGYDSSDLADIVYSHVSLAFHSNIVDRTSAWSRV